MQAGDRVVAGERVDIKPGNAAPLRSIPVGTIIHNVELKPGHGGQLARSAGAYAQLVGRDGDSSQLRLGSGEIRRVRSECMASVGAVSNPDHQNTNLGKAGRTRWKGRRPHNRGVTMNPIDHPHGGGEGRTSGGRHPVTPWGQPTKGHKTRRNKKTTGMIIRSRHLAKKRGS
jgi:large subunit ribosomal protein L2